MRWEWCSQFFYSAISLKQQTADRHVAPLAHIIISLKQQTVDRHVAPLAHIILILCQPRYQTLIFLFNAVCLTEKKLIPIL